MTQLMQVSRERESLVQDQLYGQSGFANNSKFIQFGAGFFCNGLMWALWSFHVRKKIEQG